MLLLVYPSLTEAVLCLLWSSDEVRCWLFRRAPERRMPISDAVSSVRLRWSATFIRCRRVSRFETIVLHGVLSPAPGRLRSKTLSPRCPANRRSLGVGGF